MNWISAAVGLGGMAVAALSLLLTFRSRLAPYQQKLYERQLEASTDVLHALGRYHDEALARLDQADAPAGDDEARAEFFRSYRRWIVVIPQPITEAVTAYLRTLGQPHDAAGLAHGYAAVLAAAQRELQVKALSGTTLGMIESMSRRPTEPSPTLDPLYVKAIAERPLFESFVDESATGRPGGPGGASLRATRDQVYVHNRNLFLVHAWRPSPDRTGWVDIAVRLVEHTRRGNWPAAGQASRERPISDQLVERVEYYLGPSFARTFVKDDAETGFRLDVSSYGPTLCLARVHLADRTEPMTLYRYLDFVSADR